MARDYFQALALGAMLAGALASPARAAPRPAADGQSTLARAEKSFPTHTIWLLREFNGKPVPAGDDLTLSIDETFRGSGFSGCNTWSATLYPVRGQRLAMGPVALTRNVCPQPRMALERAYLTALHSGPAWDLAGDELVVKSRAGMLKFRRSL